MPKTLSPDQVQQMSIVLPLQPSPMQMQQEIDRCIADAESTGWQLDRVEKVGTSYTCFFRR